MWSKKEKKLCNEKVSITVNMCWWSYAADCFHWSTSAWKKCLFGSWLVEIGTVFKKINSGKSLSIELGIDVYFGNIVLEYLFEHSCVFSLCTVSKFKFVFLICQHELETRLKYVKRLLVVLYLNSLHITRFKTFHETLK